MKLKSLVWLLSAVTVVNAFGNTSVKVSNNLGNKLALAKAQTSKNENFMISPVSLQQALSLAVNGTVGHTRSLIELMFDADLEQVNAEGKNFVEKINFSKEQKEQMQRRNRFSNPAVISIQNSIWRTNGKTDGRIFKFSESFQQIAKGYYGAEATSLDFKQAEGADGINAWSKEKTYGLVPKIIDQDQLSPMLWVIMNATYMEAAWKKPFHKLTYNTPKFHLLDGTTKDAKMIQSTQYIGHAQLTDGSELAAIDLSDDQQTSELAFMVYLPSANSNFQTVQDEVYNAEFWDMAQEKVLDRQAMVKAKITLPKFSFDTSVEMKEDEVITEKMGLNFLFKDYADFAAMATADSVPSKVGLIKQNSRIELDEKGIKAAAVTIVGGVERTSMPLPPRVEMVVDRPFVFAIVDKKSKAILFLGSVVNP